ncbi:unnamed protein product [Protopolystoma xenopodis]|uniref:Uncharacterized protein n=1 Tax=Protopolystoma xenopodis TaxID=117903 RepID=A0A448WZN9_9PLAT|nr:unnamed protein product [Protopolystoma xenopodis]
MCASGTRTEGGTSRTSKPCCPQVASSICLLEASDAAEFPETIPQSCPHLPSFSTSFLLSFLPYSLCHIAQSPTSTSSRSGLLGYPGGILPTSTTMDKSSHFSGVAKSADLCCDQGWGGQVKLPGAARTSI